VKSRACGAHIRFTVIDPHIGSTKVGEYTDYGERYGRSGMKRALVPLPFRSTDVVDSSGNGSAGLGANWELGLAETALNNEVSAHSVHSGAANSEHDRKSYFFSHYLIFLPFWYLDYKILDFKKHTT
jgi:hypothetical protein